MTLPSYEEAASNTRRPEEGVGALLEAASRIARKGYQFHFGPERQKHFVAVREEELKALAGEPCAPPPPEAQATFTGGEHDVWITDPVERVVKHTLCGYYGRTISEDNFLQIPTYLNKRQLKLCPALPSEYLLRWAICWSVFGIPTWYLGCRPDRKGEPRMVISQPFIEQDDEDPASIEEVEAFFHNHGFVKVDWPHLALLELKDVTWYREKDGILIADAHARNFRKAPDDGFLIPVDLMVSLVSRGGSEILPSPTQPWTPEGLV
jgi:hypothetical protein